jgi:hypothetical protein
MDMDDNVIKFRKPRKPAATPKAGTATARRKLLVIGVMILIFIVAYKFFAVTPPSQ